MQLLTEEQKKMPYFVGDKDALNEKYKIIKANQIEIDNWCKAHPESAKFLRKQSRHYSLYDGYDLAVVEENIEKDKMGAIGLESTIDTINRNDVVVARVVEAMNFVSSCVNGNPEGITFNKDEYLHIGKLLICRVNNILGYNTNRDYRTGYVHVQNADIEALNPAKIPSRMAKLFGDIEFGNQDMTSIEKAAMFVAETWKIQPFDDGNKRTATITANFILEKDGIGRLSLKGASHLQFSENLKEAVMTKDISKLAHQFADSIISRQHDDKHILTVKHLKKLVNEEAEVEEPGGFGGPSGFGV